jgi:hypothetical protein
MDTTSKVVLGITGSIASICVASFARIAHRSKEATKALDQMGVEIRLIQIQFNDADISHIQAERAIDVVVDKYKHIYMCYTLSDKASANEFFEIHRAGSKKLLGFPV